MVLGDPVAVIAEAVDVPREIDAVLERGRRWRAGRDEGEIEDGKGRHEALPIGGTFAMHIGIAFRSATCRGFRAPLIERRQAGLKFRPSYSLSA